MVNISPELREAFNPNNGEGARYIDWSVRFKVVQDEARQAITPSATENTAISRLAQTVDDDMTMMNFGSFELNGFPLDGSGVIPPRRNEASSSQVGLVMNTLSDTNGYFQTPQVFTATTPNKYNLIAVTLVWGYAPARDFKVDWYTDSTIVKTTSVTDNTSMISVLSTAVPNVNKVVVTVTRTLPIHFMRLAEFIPGAIVEYNGMNSDSFDYEDDCDTTNERVPAGTMRLVADNFAQQFNIFEPDGVYLYFHDRMLLESRIGARTQSGAYGYVDLCKRYLKAPKLKGNMSKLELDATGILGVLSNTSYSKGRYRTGTIASFINEVAADVGVTVKFPTSFSTMSMTAYIATMAHAQAFRLLAQATNTLLVVRRDDTVEFLSPGTASLQTIGQDDYSISNGFSPSDTDIYNTADVTYVTITQEAAASELSKTPATGAIQSSVFYVDNAIITTTTGAYTPKYDPATNVSAAITGGNLVLTGTRLILNETVMSVTTRQPNEQAYIYDKVKDNIFVQTSNAASVAAHALMLKAQKRRQVKISYRGYPYFEMGDIVKFNTGGTDTQPFILSKNSLKLAGGMSGAMEARER